jgi:hypothetical protein
MPLPLAAIATAATAAGMEYLRQRNQSAGAGTGPQVGKLIVGGTALRASTAALLGSPAMSLVGPAPSQVPITTGAPGAGAAGIGAAIGRALGGRGLNAPAAPMINRGAQGLQQIQEFLVTGGVIGRKKYRRMDHCNIKALRRAGRRLEGFVKLAKQMVQLHARARVKKPRRRR